MREIRFRAFHIAEKKMLFESYTGEIFQWHREQQPVEIMQFTGLRDKNGREIYEGDIIELESDQFFRGKIWWREDKASFAYDDLSLAEIMDHELEVIGNIHENPELLK